MTPDDQSDPGPAPALGAQLQALRTAMASVNAPRGVEKELMDAFATQFPPKRWYHALSPGQWGLAGGVGSTALVAVIALSLSLHAPPQPGADRAPALAFDDGAPFIALESAERIEQEPNPRMLEADLPRTALASLGVPVSPENADESVRAELLVGADGAPLALRLVALP